MDTAHAKVSQRSREPPNCSHPEPIPDHVHQPWLGGGTMRWEQVLAVASVRFLGQPAQHTIYYDRKPRDTKQWRCACAFATACVHRKSQPMVGNKDVANAAHRSDLMRLDVLEEHGGIYVDHDAFVLRSLSQLRRCTGTGVRAGYEYFSRDRHKLNNGVLLARAGARFLSLWREAYSKDFRPSEWDYNSCVVPFQLARRSAARTHGLA